MQKLILKDEPNADGRYPCRFVGCTASCNADGVRRQIYEQSHNPPVSSHCSESEMFFQESDQTGDMFNYQRTLLEYGMLVENIKDAVSAGDCLRVIRCWKFFLYYFKHGGGSQKYSLEILYLMF